MQSIRSNVTTYGALLPILFVYVVPIFILSNNISEFPRIKFWFTIPVLAIFSVVISLIVVFILFLFKKIMPLNYILSITVKFFLIFFLLTGLILPLTGEAGQIEIDRIPVNAQNLMIAITCAFALLVISFTSLGKPLLVGMAALILFTGVRSTISCYIQMSHNSSSRPTILEASKKKNVFVLSFDGLPMPLVQEALNENPDFKKELRDFHIFSNVISSAPATFASITSELYGDEDLKAQFGDMDGMKAKLDRARLMPNHLEKNGVKVSAYVYGLWFDNPARSYTLGSLVPPPLIHEKVENTSELFDYSVARMATSQFVFRKQIAQAAIAILHRYKLDDEYDTVAFQHRLQGHKGTDWDKGNLLSMVDFEAYVSGLVPVETAPAAHFLHFLHTHFPVDFDRNCQYRSDDKAWFDGHQNRDGAKNEVICAVSQMVKFVRRLKELGIYDQSLIVLKSDHGQPVAYGNPANFESFTVRKHTYWGYFRYLPFLAIKNINGRGSEIAHDDRPVVLSDLAKTLCKAMTPSTGCDNYKGYDLLDPNVVIPADATYFVDIVKGPESSHLIDTHDGLKFKRSKHFLRELNSMLSAEIIKSNLRCDVNTDLTKGEAYNNGKSDYHSWVTWFNDSVSYIKFRAPLCREQHATIRVATTDDLAIGSADLNVSVNDVPVKDMRVSRVGDRSTDITLDLASGHMAENSDYVLISIGSSQKAQSGGIKPMMIEVYSRE